jgi:2-polyprenyl-6-hydroxyphenyl methylase/3-demethylubiquinone-9 3-methyltransferase
MSLARGGACVTDQGEVRAAARLAHQEDAGPAGPAIDNDVYNRLAASWWDETGLLSILRTLLNPARFGYFRRILTEVLQMNLRGKEALDIGCGGGFLAEEFAGLGCRVTGIDPSEPSLATARAHARQSGLDITYLQATGEALPFPDESFDIVYCCDVLEHVSDLECVIAQSSRVLRRGGVYCYDTINRTLRSKLVAIKLLQEWQATRIMPTKVHNWQMFIKPGELLAALARHGIANRELRGMQPEANPLQFVGLLRGLKRGEIGFADLGRQGGRFIESTDVSVSYMGYGIKH